MKLLLFLFFLLFPTAILAQAPTPLDLPTPAGTTVTATKIAPAIIEIEISGEGFAAATISLGSHIGLEKDETDKVTGFKKFDIFESRYLLRRIKLGEMKAFLDQAVIDGKITQSEVNSLIANIISDYVRLYTRHNEIIDLLRRAEYPINLPDKPVTKIK